MTTEISTPTPKSLFINKLNESGLTPDDATLLGMTILEPLEATKLGYRPLPSLYIEYYNPNEDYTPMYDRSLIQDPTAQPYSRVRYLELPTKLAPTTDKAKYGKYSQPKGSLPCAYYPRNLKVKWSKVVKDSKCPLIITEGELKAAKACKHGFATIGLGGVNSYASKKHGIPLIESLTLINWYRRRVMICFDSDFIDNKNIIAAIRGLAEILESLGAMTYVVIIPQSGDAKVGLDDYLVSNEGNEVDALKALLTVAQPLGCVQALMAVNDRFTFCKQPMTVIDYINDHKYTAKNFKDFIYNTEQHIDYVMSDKGEIKQRAISVSRKWLMWFYRNQVDEISYAPGEPKFYGKTTSKGTIKRYYNDWQGWACEPKQGDVRLWLTLIDFLFRDAPASNKEWFLQWLAYPIQNPGAKLYTSCLLHSPQTGTGKSMIGYIMQRVYGSNFIEIHQDDLDTNRNDWAINKQFVLADDISGLNNRKLVDKWNKRITQAELKIDQKYIQSYVVKDCLNYYMTSNQPDALYISKFDRRYFVHNVGMKRLSNDFYMNKMDKWLRSKECGSSMFYYLLKDVCCASFNPTGHAPETTSKSIMVREAESDIDTWVSTLLTTPEVILKTSPRDLFSNSELLQMYDPMGEKRVTANGLGRVMSRHGAQKVLGGKLIYTDAHTADRYYIIRNVTKWTLAGKNAIVENIRVTVQSQVVGF